jgi:uncharacterized membrane protein SirB2
MTYITVRYLHQVCAALSGGLFLLRGRWMLVNSPMQQQRWVRIVPHIIDTLLLGCGVTLAVWSQLNPLEHRWLAVKLIALLCYIVLGSIALKRGKTRSIRLLAFIAAVLVFAGIIVVAVTKI